jgi:hypothetical protein
MSRTTAEVCHVAAGEHMVPGPFHLEKNSENLFSPEIVESWYHQKLVLSKVTFDNLKFLGNMTELA